MERKLQSLYLKIKQQANLTSFPKPPPTLINLLSSTQNKNDLLPTYGEIDQQIKSQLLKRIINISKIKQISSQLYKKLNEDIMKLKQYSELLERNSQAIQKIQQIELLFEQLVKQMIKGYAQAKNAAQPKRLLYFVEKTYFPFCHLFNKRVISTYKQTMEKLKFTANDISRMKTEQNNQIILQGDFREYSQKMITVLQRIRQILTQQYQSLLSTPRTLQQESKSGVILLAKLSNIFNQVKQVIHGEENSMHKIQSYFFAWRSKVFSQISTSYNRIIGIKNPYYTQQLNLFASPSTGSEWRGQQDQFEIVHNFSYLELYVEVLVYMSLLHFIHYQIIDMEKKFEDVTSKAQNRFLDHSIKLSFIEVSINPLLKDLSSLFSQINLKSTYYFEECENQVIKASIQLIDIMKEINQIKYFIAKYHQIWGQINNKLIYLLPQNYEFFDLNIWISLCLDVSQLEEDCKKLVDYIYDNRLQFKFTELIKRVNTQLSEINRLKIKLSKVDSKKQYIQNLNENINLKVNTIYTKGKAIDNKNERDQKKSEALKNASFILDIKNEDLRGSEVFVQLDDEQFGSEEHSLSYINISNLKSGNNLKIDIEHFIEEANLFFEKQLKNLIGNGTQLAIFAIQSPNLFTSDFKISKAIMVVNKLLNNAQFDVSQLKKNLKNGYTITTADDIKYLQMVLLNLKIANNLFKSSYNLKRNKAISTLISECLNFEHKDERQTKIFETNYRLFEKSCKQIYQLSQTHLTSMSPTLYKITKQFAINLEMACDVISQIFFIFSTIKDEQKVNKRVKKEFDLFSEKDFEFVSMVLSYKTKMKQQIDQIQKFNHISKQMKNCLHLLYSNFYDRFNNYLPYPQEYLGNLAKVMQIAFSLSQNHDKIFSTFFQSIASANSKDEIERMWEIAEQVNQLSEYNKYIEKLVESKWADVQNIQLIRELFFKYKQAFKLASITFLLFSGKTKNSETKFDEKTHKLYEKVMALHKKYKQWL